MLFAIVVQENQTIIAVSNSIPRIITNMELKEVTMKMNRKLLGLINTMFPVKMAKLRYKKWFGKSLDLDNPQDINAKILWLSLFSDTREWSRLADKYAVREFVKERGCEQYLNRLYQGGITSVDQINWDNLPNEFIIKSNTGCGDNLIVSDKSKMNVKEVEAKIQGFLKYKPIAVSSEFHYLRIKPPCILIEELLHNDEAAASVSSSLIDYKIWCFDGKPYTFLLVANRKLGKVNLYDYDLNWNNHPEHMRYDKFHLRPENEIPKPQNMEEMLEVAKKLSAGFPVVRVDFYNVNGRIYFGEMTFTSNGGIMSYYNFEYAKEMGKHIDISSVKKDPLHWRGR